MTFYFFVPLNKKGRCVTEKDCVKCDAIGCLSKYWNKDYAIFHWGCCMKSLFAGLTNKDGSK